MTILDEPALETPDRGTPAVLGEATAHVTVDGIAVMVPVGTSVMRAASLAGVAVPKLCATDSLEAFGSCRLCLVEVEGRRERRRRARPRAPTAWWCRPEPSRCSSCAAA